MSSANVRRYSSADQMEKAYLAAKVELTPTQHRPYEAHVVHLKFDRLWMQRVDESAPRIKWAAQSPQRTFIRFLTRSGPSPLVDGIPLRDNEIIHFSRGHNYFEHSFDRMSWGALSLPVDDPMAERLTIAGRDIGLPQSPTHLVPAPAAFARLMRLHAEVGIKVETDHAHIIADTVSHALEQSLLDALADCLSHPVAQSVTSAHKRHDVIMRRFRRILEEAPDQALYVPEICDAINVPERTLRLCCQERLGMGPKQYLLLRRMHMAWRALGASDPTTTTVTDIATRFGFWHFGRFAGCYRLIFGEPPSVTLQRGARRR
jgi:AraC-like DNA-binding protein